MFHKEAIELKAEWAAATVLLELTFLVPLSQFARKCCEILSIISF